MCFFLLYSICICNVHILFAGQVSRTTDSSREANGKERLYCVSAGGKFYPYLNPCALCFAFPPQKFKPYVCIKIQNDFALELYQLCFTYFVPYLIKNQNNMLITNTRWQMKRRNKSVLDSYVHLICSVNNQFMLCILLSFN